MTARTWTGLMIAAAAGIVVGLSQIAWVIGENLF